MPAAQNRPFLGQIAQKLAEFSAVHHLTCCSAAFEAFFEYSRVLDGVFAKSAISIAK
jgi:hypothetical protein